MNFVKERTGMKFGRNGVPPGHNWGIYPRMNLGRELRNVTLVGFMGTGKSTVGQHVATQLHYHFLDTDAMVEQRVGKTIPKIFADDGEPAFRQLECETVAKLAEMSSVVIATGGGLVCNPANMASLKTHSLVVCLWAAPDTIWRRVKNQSHRPLLQDPNPQAKIERLLAEREPHYRTADVLVSTEFRSVREVAHQICHQLEMARRDIAHS